MEGLVSPLGTRTTTVQMRKWSHKNCITAKTICGCKMWSQTKARENMVVVVEKEMERKMFGVSLCNHTENQTLRQISDVKDIVVATRESKIRFD